MTHLRLVGAAPDPAARDAASPDTASPDTASPDTASPDTAAADAPARRGPARTGVVGGTGEARPARRRSGRRSAPEPPDHGDRPPEADADPRSVARTIALRLLAARPRTRAELATALAGRGVPDEPAAEVLDRFTELGYLDDRAFAQSWVTGRAGRGLSRRALAVELRRRGVAADDAAAALADLDPDAEYDTARALAVRRARALRGVEPTARYRRLAGMLARKGYPPGVVNRAVREALAEVGAEVGGQVGADDPTEDPLDDPTDPDA